CAPAPRPAPLRGERPPLLREPSRGRRQALALGERLVEPGEPLPRELRTVGEVVATPRRGPRRLDGPCLQRRAKRFGGLAPQREPLARGTQSVERRVCALARSGGVGQLLLGAAPLRQHLPAP